MNSGDLKIVNANIITPNRIFERGCIVVKEGKIVSVSDSDMGDSEMFVIDADGNYATPGFIDIHVHGGFGHDFMDNTLQAFLEIARFHARHGTTSFMPTTLSCEADALQQTIRMYETADKLNTM